MTPDPSRPGVRRVPIRCPRLEVHEPHVQAQTDRYDIWCRGRPVVKTVTQDDARRWV